MSPPPVPRTYWWRPWREGWGGLDKNVKRLAEEQLWEGTRTQRADVFVLSRFGLFPAHRLCRDVGFIIVRRKTRGPRRLSADFESGKQKDQRASGQVVERERRG